MAFVQGWSLDFAMAAEGRMLSSGRYATVNAPAAATPRPAVSLTHLRSRYLNQGAAGTCYAHSAAQLFEITAKSLGFEPFPASRRFIAYNTKQVEDKANPADGASPTDAIRVMTDGGVGVANEKFCPYSDDRNVLAQRPPQAAFDDARKSHLQVPISVKSFDQVVALIDGQNGTVPGLPTANGFQCPVEMQGNATFVKNISSYLGGHSELCVGFAQPGVFDEYWWLELEGSWALIYKPLPPSLAKLVYGYEPASATKTSSNWVRKDVYLQCCQQGCEHVSATTIAGLGGGGPVVPSDSLAAILANVFPV